MERYQDEKALTHDEIIARDLEALENNRFLNEEEKQQRRIKLRNAEPGQDMRFKALLTNPSSTFPGRAAFVKMVIKKLKDIDFEAFKECYDLSQPPVSSQDLIPIIIGEIADTYPINNENYPVILAVCYYLIAPAKNIHHDVKLEIGVRDKLANALGFANPETVNAYSLYILPMFKNPRFKAKVTDLGDKIYNELREAGFLDA